MHIAYISINEVFDMHVLCIVLHWYNDNAILGSWIIHNFNLVDLQPCSSAYLEFHSYNNVSNNAAT